MVSPRDNRCRSCGRPIVWGWTDRGRAMPLDPHPNYQGSIAARELPEGRFIRVLRGAQDPARDEIRMMSHRTSCPAGDRKRRDLEVPAFNDTSLW